MRISYKLIRGLSVLLGLLAAAGSAHPTNAEFVTVSYSIFEEPENPLSPEVFRVVVTLDEYSRAGETIGWNVVQVECRKFGGTTLSWIGVAPEVDTADGLWYVTHADADVPTAADFTTPPVISGTGDSQQIGGADLEFQFRGAMYIAPASGPHYSTTAALDYEFNSDNQAMIPPATQRPAWLRPVEPENPGVE
jgi:hypothetical protein